MIATIGMRRKLRVTWTRDEGDDGDEEDKEDEGHEDESDGPTPKGKGKQRARSPAGKRDTHSRRSVGDNLENDDAVLKLG